MYCIYCILGEHCICTCTQFIGKSNVSSDNNRVCHFTIVPHTGSVISPAYRIAGNFGGD